MKRAFTIVATVATLFAAHSAAAAEHTILILPDAYFPTISYIDSGDTVRFVNVSGGEHNIIAKNDSWEIGPIPDNGEVTMLIDSTVQKTFYDKDAVDADGAYLIEGAMSFSDAPLN